MQRPPEYARLLQCGDRWSPVAAGEASRHSRLSYFTSKVEHGLVGVTPAQVLARFKGFDDGMVGMMKILGSMLVLRRVAAANTAARQAQAHGTPGITCLQAFLAAARVGRNVADLIQAP